MKKIFCTTSVVLTMLGLMASPAKADDVKRLGDMMMVMSPAYAWGMTIMENDWDGTIQLGEVMLGTQATVEGLKLLKLEERPNHHDKRSFPSGHATAAFSGAMFVHKRYGWKPALVPYTMAVITSWARVKGKNHYAHDTIAGAAISAVWNWLLVDKYVPNKISITADTNSVGLNFNTKF